MSPRGAVEEEEEALEVEDDKGNGKIERTATPEKLMKD